MQPLLPGWRPRWRPGPTTCWPVQLSTALAALIVVAACQQVAQPEAAAGDSARAERARFAQVQPFTMDQLPEPERPGARESSQGPWSVKPGLGRMARLHAPMWPKLGTHNNTRFYLYTAGHGRQPEIQFRARAPERLPGDQVVLDPEHDYQFDLRALAASKFDVEKPTVFVIPGWNTWQLSAWQLEAAKYLSAIHRNQVNVVLVTWHQDTHWLYPQAAADTVLVARQVTILLHYLAQLAGTNLASQNFLDRIHLVGFSLGAHIAGFVGQDLGGRVSRVTGLDPAGPLFDHSRADQRLDRSQAQLVDVLHTNAGRMNPLMIFMTVLVNSATGHDTLDSGAWFGNPNQLGHIDYYANDGRIQLGCRDAAHICDHSRAYEIFVDLLKYQLFARDQHERAQGDRALKYTRLWAFRARNFESFASGAQFAELCPHLVSPELHLQPGAVARTFNRCAVPQMDFLRPAREIIAELRDKYAIDFTPEARPADQPKFFFRTQPKAYQDWQHLPMVEVVGKQFLLKVYLDPIYTKWDSRKCTLWARLNMDNGDALEVETSQISRGQAVLALPFAHAAGVSAYEDLERLVALLERPETRQAPAASEELTRLLRVLFPRTVQLQLASKVELNAASTTEHQQRQLLEDRPKPRAGRECRLALKELEIHPITSERMAGNVGVVSGKPTKRGRVYEFITAAKMLRRLAQARNSYLGAEAKTWELERDSWLALVEHQP